MGMELLHKVVECSCFNASGSDEFPVEMRPTSIDLAVVAVVGAAGVENNRDVRVRIAPLEVKDSPAMAVADQAAEFGLVQTDVAFQ